MSCYHYYGCCYCYLLFLCMNRPHKMHSYGVGGAHCIVDGLVSHSSNFSSAAVNFNTLKTLVIPRSVLMEL